MTDKRTRTWHGSNGDRCRSVCGRAECFRVGSDNANMWGIWVDGMEYAPKQGLKAAKARAVDLLQGPERPPCRSCGKRWCPLKGIDAKVVPCHECQQAHASKMRELRFELED